MLCDASQDRPTVSPAAGLLAARGRCQRDRARRRGGFPSRRRADALNRTLRPHGLEFPIGIPNSRFGSRPYFPGGTINESAFIGSGHACSSVASIKGGDLVLTRV